MYSFFYWRSTRDNQWYFHFKSLGNNEIVLAGSEGYVSESGCLNGIRSVKENAPYEARYERFQGRDNLYYFRLKAANGEIIGKSEGYTTSYSRDNGIEIVKREAPNAPTSRI